MLSNCGAGESLGLQGEQTSQSWGKSTLNTHWKDWCWSWNSSILVIWCEPSHWKSPWCWERLRATGEGDNRGWDGWMASPTQWTWVWVDSWGWWWTGRPGVLWFMGHEESDTTEQLNSRCPSADEWIRKLWYIYTMEYYSAIKKNTFESVLMRWMKPEPDRKSVV